MGDDSLFMPGSVGIVARHCKALFNSGSFVSIAWPRYNSGMLQLSGMLINRPVLSLRTGTPIGTTLSPIINPNNLKIEGFYCQENSTRKTLVLLSQDIREILVQGIVVNDLDALTEPEELIRLKDILKVNFELLGKVVITGKERVGKVGDYAVDIDSMFIQKLYVSQSVFKSFSGGNLGIDRSQIIEITDKRIVIHDLAQKVPIGVRAVA
jgi:sporulation protein YlmC with PRC-barrel domain